MWSLPIILHAFLAVARIVLVSVNERLVIALLLFLFPWKGVADPTALRGIALVSPLSDIHSIERSKIDGLYVDESVFLPGTVEELKQQLSHLGYPPSLDRASLLAVRNEIIKYFNRYQQYAVYVSIPQQEVISGVVLFEVLPAKIGTVEYTGNRWFSQSRVQNALALQPGEELNVDRLLNQVSWLNFNPFHHTEVVFSPSVLPGRTDIEVVTADRFLLRVYGGGDNTGTEATGTSRYYLGFTWGDAFFINDLWSYQFTMNQDFSRFSSHTMSYLSFLPCQHMLTLFGAYALMHPEISGFDSKGKDALLSFRYKIPFKPLYTPLQHNFYFGIDYKYFTSILFFLGEATAPELVMNSQVNVTQAMLGYLLEYNASPHQVLFRFECFGSPMKWLPHQSAEAYAGIRPFAAPRYFYFTTSLGEIFTFPSKLAIAGLLRIQGSASTLIPSEQFKLGGYNSVRGYEESVVISDNAICMNYEIRSSPLSFTRHARDALTFLAFLDYGWGYNYHPFNGIAQSATLVGIGPGIRYRIDPYLEIRCDYGFKLHSVEFDDNKLGMFHVGMTLGY